MIPLQLGLKDITKTSFAVIKAAVDRVVKRAEYAPFGPFALFLANAISAVVKAGVQGGPRGLWIKVKDAIPKLYPLVWNSVPPLLRSKLEGFFVEVLKQLT